MANDIWARDVVLTELRRRDRGGEGPASKDSLQEKCGIGPTDLEVTLGVLVDEGSVIRHDDETFALNAIEGEERSPDADELLDAADAPAGPSVPGWQPPDDGKDEAPPVPPQLLPYASEHPPGHVVLTRGMVEKLTDEAFGNVMKAALGDRPEGRFVLVIE